MNFWITIICIAFIFFIFGFFSCALFTNSKTSDLYDENNELKIESNRKDQVINFYKAREKELSNNTKTIKK